MQWLAVALGLLCGLLVGCASPMVIISPTPTISPAPSEPVVVITHITYACPTGAPTNGATPVDRCPAEEAAILPALANVDYTVASVTILPRGFGCGPFLGPSACIVASTGPAAYVTFYGTDGVAALTLTPTHGGSFTATLVAYRLPPAGWQIP